MSGPNRPLLPSQSPQERNSDPFADRSPHLHFQEPLLPPDSSFQPTASVASFPSEFGANAAHEELDDDEEKQPLTTGGFTGGFYPPPKYGAFLRSS